MKRKIALQAIILVLVLVFKSYEKQLLKGFNTELFDTILNYFSFVLTLSFVKGVIFYFHRKARGLKRNEEDNLISGINNIYVLLVGIVGILTGISLLGIDVRGLFYSLSIIAAAIAVISKDYISNVIGGMLIAFSDDINVGDYIRVGLHKGKVIDLSVTMLSLLTDEDDVVIIPNHNVYSMDVVNYTKRTIKKTSIEFEIMLESLQTITELEADLIAALDEYQDLIKPNSYNLKIVGIKKDYIEFKFQYVLNTPDREMENAIRKKVIRKVVQAIKKL